MIQLNIFLDLFYFLAFVVFILILSGGIVYLANFLRKREILKTSLGFGLYEVSLPKFKEGQEERKTFKEIIGATEQFYLGMLSITPYFVLEMVSPANENETTFYVALPKNQYNVFEKQIHSIFPEANIRQDSNDYNIFKYKGFHSGAIVGLEKHPSLPIKTYKDLEVDPLEVLANVFAGFSKDEEGASLQVVVSPIGNELFKKNVLKMISLIQNGVSPREVFASEWKKFFFSLRKEQTENDKKSFQKADFSGEKTVELMNSKISKNIVRVNIRLVASAKSKEKSKKILKEMESMFNQFNNPQGNSFRIKELKGRTLRNLFHRFSFRLFEKKNSIYLNTTELTTIFHFPVFKVSAPKVKFLKVKRVEPPSNLPQKGLLIGKNIFRNKETKVFIKSDDRRRHFYIIGQTGTGKTVLMENMIIQDIAAGNGLCFIDPHGDSVEKIMGQIPKERWKDVIYFNPADIKMPMGLNMLEYDPRFPEHKTLIVNELLEIFNKLYNMREAGGPIFEQYFRNAALLVMEDPSSGNTLLEIPRVLADPEFRQLKLSRSKNPVVNNFWTQIAEKVKGEHALSELIPYITSKFDGFLSNEIMRPIVCQQQSSFNLREVLDQGKILLVNLSKGKLGETNSYLLGMILTGRIFMAAMSRVDIPEDQRKDFYLYIDEFQNVTTRTIAMILSEARKYRLNLIIAHQFIGQLEEEIKKSVFGNIGSICAFRIANEDAEFLSKHFEPVFSPEDLIIIPNFNAYLKLLIDGQISLPFNIETFPPAYSDLEAKERLKKFSAVQYGRPLEEIEGEIEMRLKGY